MSRLSMLYSHCQLAMIGCINNLVRIGDYDDAVRTNPAGS